MPTTSPTKTRTIEIDVTRMIAGLFEMFDDLADLALNRVVRRTEDLEGGFNPTLVNQDEVNRFKITWFVVLGELAFREIRGEKISDVVDAYYKEMGIIAGERQAQDFLETTTAAVREMIDGDAAYAEDGTVNKAVDGNGAAPHNEGLAPDLAAVMAKVSFADNPALTPIYAAIGQTVEEELLNAYGQASLSCAPFVVI